MAQRQTHRYDAFGLSISSEFEVAELRAGNERRPVDLAILDRDIGRDLPTKQDGVVFDYADPDGVVMAWPGVAAFRFVDERTIWARKYEEAPDKYFAFPLLGPVMAWFLTMQHLFVLHASAVHWEGRTLAFMGDKLAGKSTTAAAFIRAGCSLVTDDLLAIELAKGQPAICYPAFPQLKLEDVASQKIQVAGATPRPLVMEGFPKRQHALAQMTTEAVSIDCLVQLERGGDTPIFEPLSKADGPAALNRYSYLQRFGDASWRSDDHARHFGHCVTLAERARVGRLRIPADLDTLDATVELMLGVLRETPP